MDVKWELGVLMDHYAERTTKLDKYDFEGQRKLKDLYAQAIILNVKKGYGIVYPIDDFIKAVRGSCYTDYDGGGDLLNADGNTLGNVRCNVKYLKSAKSVGAVYVAWYNK